MPTGCCGGPRPPLRAVVVDESGGTDGVGLSDPGRSLTPGARRAMHTGCARGAQPANYAPERANGQTSRHASLRPVHSRTGPRPRRWSAFSKVFFLDLWMVLLSLSSGGPARARFLRLMRRLKPGSDDVDCRRPSPRGAYRTVSPQTSTARGISARESKAIGHDPGCCGADHGPSHQTDL